MFTQKPKYNVGDRIILEGASPTNEYWIGLVCAEHNPLSKEEPFSFKYGIFCRTIADGNAKVFCLAGEAFDEAALKLYIKPIVIPEIPVVQGTPPAPLLEHTDIKIDAT